MRRKTPTTRPITNDYAAAVALDLGTLGGMLKAKGNPYLAGAAWAGQRVINELLRRINATEAGTNEQIKAG